MVKKNKTCSFIGFLIAMVILFVFTNSVNAANVTLSWAKNLGGASNFVTVFKTVVDTSGNSYVTGYFTGTVDFDPGAGTTNLVSAGTNDIFITKFDTSGNLLWAKGIGAAVETGWGGDVNKSVAVDSSGNVYVSGFFSGTVDFDPGAGTSNLTTSGGVDIYVLKLDTNGDFVWVKKMGGTNSEEAVATAVDSSGNVYITGGFLGTVDFDPGAGTSNLVSGGGYDIFVTKLDTDGTFVWAKRMLGGSGYDFGRSILVDSSFNVYVSGQFTGTVDFDPDAGTSNKTSAGGEDIFVTKLDSSGSLVWISTVGGTSADGSWSLAFDSSNNLYTTGSFQGTVDFDPGAGTTSLTSAGSNDVFIQKLDNSGNFVYVKQIGGTGSDLAYSIYVDSGDNVFTGGFFNSTVDFDPGAGATSLTSVGGDDIFINKLDSSGDFVYVKQIGGTGNEQVKSLFVDSTGVIYAFGQMAASVDLDPNGGVDTHTIVGTQDLFLLKLTPDSTSPVISSVNSFNVTESGVTVSWSTDENSSSMVEYGLTTNYGSSTSESDTGAGVTSHSVSLSNLTACNTYHYRVKSNDVVANLGTSSDYTFTTPCLGVVPVWILQAMSEAIQAKDNQSMLPATAPASNNTQVPVDTSIATKFLTNLTYKSRGLDILELQKFLNANGYTVALTGAGSVGFETMYFGPATRKALIKFQRDNDIIANGYFGPVTRRIINQQLDKKPVL